MAKEDIFLSDGGCHYRFNIANVAFAKVNANKMDIYFKDKNHLSKRITLEDLLLEWKDYPYMRQCHRGNIVNIDFVFKFDEANSLLTLFNEMEVDISHQYHAEFLIKFFSGK